MFSIDKREGGVRVVVSHEVLSLWSILMCQQCSLPLNEGKDLVDMAW